MNGVDQVILSVDVVNVNVVVIAPVAGPRFRVFKPIAAVTEAAVISALNMERVFPPAMGTEAVIWNASAATIALPLVRAVLFLTLRLLVRSTSLFLGRLPVRVLP